MDKWTAGEASLQQARGNGDHRGDQLVGVYKNAQLMAGSAGKAIRGSMGVGAAGICVLMIAGACASGGALAPLAAAAIMQSSLTVALLGVVSAGFSKLWKNAESSKAEKIAPFVSAVNSGNSVQSAIDSTFGEDMAAKLGGWRKSKPAVEAGSKNPAKPKT